jgi:hypothetical protein
MPERQNAVPHVWVCGFVGEMEIFLGAHHSLYKHSPITGAGKLEQEVAVAGPLASGAELTTTIAATTAVCPLRAKLEHVIPIIPDALKIGDSDARIELNGIIMGPIRYSDKSNTKKERYTRQRASPVKRPGSESTPD